MAAPRVIRVQYEVNNSEIKASADLWRQVARELGHSEEEADALADDFKRAGEEAKRSGKAINQTANDARKAGNSIGNLAKQVAGVLSVAALAAAGREIVKQAGRIEATAKKVTAVFGAAAGSINTFAASMTDSLGISEEGIKSITASIGDLLIPMGFTEQQAASMSTELTTLSAALSDWSGGQMDAAEVGDVLAKAMLGEREALKSLGISITEADVQQRILEKGQKSLTGTALQQAKAIATQELIFEKSASAQAAFAANTDGLNKTMSQITATVGNIVNSMIQKFMPTISGAIGVVGSLITTIGDWMGVNRSAMDVTLEQVQALRQEQAQLNILAPKLADTTLKENERKTIIDQINKIAPDFIKNLGDEASSQSAIASALIETNKQYEKRIQLMLLQAAQAEVQEQFDTAIRENAKDLLTFLDAVDKTQISLIANDKEMQSMPGAKAARDSILAYYEANDIANKSLDEQQELVAKLVDKLEDEKRAMLERQGMAEADFFLQERAAGGYTRYIELLDKSRINLKASTRGIGLMQDRLNQVADAAMNAGLSMEEVTGETEEGTEATIQFNEATRQTTSVTNEAADAQRKRSEELAKAREKAAEAAREELEALQTLKVESFAAAAAQEQLYLDLVNGAGAFGETITRDMVAPIGEDLPNAMRQAEGTILDSLDAIVNAATDKEGLNLMEQLGFTQEHVNAAVSLADGLFSTIASLSQAYGAQETARLDEQMRRELERNDQTVKNEEQRAKNREKIEERFAKKKEAIDRDIAEQERRYAIFQAIINTAQAVTKALATFPPPVSYIQAGIAGAQGLAQVRLIEAQAFADGGEVKGGTPGKDSVPAMLMPNEFVMTVDNMRKHGDLIRAIHKDRVPEFFGQHTTYQVNENGQLVAEIKSLKKAIQSKREVTFRGEVFEKALFERRGRTEYLNRKYSSRK